MTARFTPGYHLIVLGVSLVLLAAMWVVLSAIPQPAGLSKEAVRLALLAPLIAALIGTHLCDVWRPRAILTVGPGGLHDARLTRGPIPWAQIAAVGIAQKGWQIIAVITLKPAAAGYGEALKLGTMPIFALNRLCARWLNRPELVIGLGGLSLAPDILMQAIEARLGD